MFGSHAIRLTAGTQGQIGGRSAPANPQDNQFSRPAPPRQALKPGNVVDPFPIHLEDNVTGPQTGVTRRPLVDDFNRDTVVEIECLALHWGDFTQGHAQGTITACSSLP